ncbi:hypothetical protein D3C75_1092080 [compost metagenome]
MYLPSAFSSGGLRVLQPISVESGSFVPQPSIEEAATTIEVKRIRFMECPYVGVGFYGGGMKIWQFLFL